MITKYSGTTKIAEVGGGMTFDDIYPIGSIYISADGTKPRLGVWEEFASGKTLLGESSSHTIGSTGGEETHTLTIDEMPSHSHETIANSAWVVYDQGKTGGSYNINMNGSFSNWAAGLKRTDKSGGGQPHNNMPPYITVTFFRRTA